MMRRMSLAGNAKAKDPDAASQKQARTPIKHVIVIVGENRSFDHLFATYQPKKGESVDNLLSKKIVNEDGTPGANFAFAQQYAADATDSAIFQLAPKKKTLYSVLAAPLNGGATEVFKGNGVCWLGEGHSSGNGLATDYDWFVV